MECACRLGPHYSRTYSSSFGAELVDSLGSEDDRVAGSAARIAGKLRADVIERAHVDALVALTAAEGRAAWVRHAAAVAVGRVGAADANARGRGGNEAGLTAPEKAPEKAPETAPETAPASNGASNAGDDAPTSPDDAAFVEAAARVESLVVVARVDNPDPDPARDRAPDLHVRAGGDVPLHHHVPRRTTTPNDAIAALLTDRCGLVRVAATATLTKARKVDCVGAMHLLLPNLRARDACLREVTCRALTSLWTDEHGVMGGAVVPAGKASVGGAETAAEGDAAVKAEVKAEAETEVKTEAKADAKTEAAPTEASPPQPVLKTNTVGEQARFKLMATTAANVAPLLDDADGGVREAAAECMGHLKESATAHLDALRGLMKDDREEAVRDAATDAMTRLGFYNPLTGSVKQRGFYRTWRPRSRGGSSGGRRPASSLSRTRACEGGATVRVWWPDDAQFYEARI